MKASSITMLVALGLSNLTAAARPSIAEAKSICGDLGVLDITTLDLPSDVNPDAVRLCKEHPEGAITEDKLDKRACHYGEPVGCSKGGHCWKTCAQPGSGHWCWTAEDSGFGDWITCDSASDCDFRDGCGAGDCQACGCSC